MRVRSIARGVTVALMSVAVLVATGDGFAQSYAGLYGWAVEHGLRGWKADSFPLMVDLFIAVGELGLFLLAIDGHRLRRSFMAWLDLLVPAGVAASGWCASLVFNVGHVAHDFPTQATAAVPPLASMIGLLVLLRTLHRYVAAMEAPAGPVASAVVAEETIPPVMDPVIATARERFADAIAAGSVPSVRAIRREMRVGHPRAVRVREALAESALQPA